MAKQKAKVSGERQVYTYSELLHASRVMLHKVTEGQGGSFYNVMASLMFTAFALEAYLNHVGSHLFECWEDLERLSPLAKMNLLSERLGIKQHSERRPYQTVGKLFKFRNSLAHGKSAVVKSKDQIRFVDDTLGGYMQEHLKTWGEKYCTQSNAKQALKDIETIIQEFHQHAGIPPEFPFSFGLQQASATVLPEDQA